MQAILLYNETVSIPNNAKFNLMYRLTWWLSTYRMGLGELHSCEPRVFGEWSGDGLGLFGSNSSIGGVPQSSQLCCWIFGARGLDGGLRLHAISIQFTFSYSAFTNYTMSYGISRHAKFTFSYRSVFTSLFSKWIHNFSSTFIFRPIGNTCCISRSKLNWEKKMKMVCVN